MALTPLALLALLAFALSARGADTPGTAPRPAYPRVNLSASYRVDPGFFQRPAGMAWGDVPGIAVDALGQVWVFTRAKPPVQVYDATGKLVRAWGETLVEKAHALRVHRDGTIWLVDNGKHVVMQCTPEGKLLRTLGTPGEAGCDPTHFNQPTDVAFGPAGDVFVTDGYGNSRVVHFDARGKYVGAWGTLGTGPGEFSIPHAIVADSRGRLYVADRNNARVQVFDATGRFLQQWQNLLVPWGLWITDRDEIWACGSSPMTWQESEGLLGCPPKDQVFMKLDTSGRLLQLWTVAKGEDGKEKPGELNWLHGIAVDRQGNIYACDIKGRRAQKFVRQP
jgi:hypothetical protein